MSFSRFFAWIIAVAVTGGSGLVIARCGFGEGSWGDDALWAVICATVAAPRVHEALLEMWSP
jgi:hypothetical protein